MRTAKKKELFLAKYSASLGHIAEACVAGKIGRTTFYTWEKSDPAFKQAIEDIDESFVDLAENQVKQLLVKGDKEFVKWFLTHKGKHRGWVDQATSEILGTVKVEVVKKIIESPQPTTQQ